MSHYFFSTFQLHDSHCHPCWLAFWNNRMMQRRIFLKHFPKEKECHCFLNSNEKCDRIKSCFIANEKTILIKINFIIAVAQPFEKYLCVFQPKCPLIHYLFSKYVSLLFSMVMRFLKKEAVADLTANKFAKLVIELHESSVIF